MVSKFTFVDNGAERIDLDEEVVLEEDESNDREEIDQDDCEDGGQEDGPAVLGHWPDHIQQRLLTVHDVQQLGGRHRTW